MEIAHGGGQGSHPHTGLGALNGTGVIAPGNIFLGLPGDPVLLRQAAQVLKQLPVIDGATVHIGDHRAFSRGAHLPVVLHHGQVGGGGGLQHQSHLRRDGEGRTEGTPGAHLLLCGEGEGHVHGELFPQQLQHHGAAHPVVDGLGLEQALPKALRRSHKGPAGPKWDHGEGLLPAGRADVQVQGVGLGDLLHVLPAEQVDGLHPDDPGDPAGPQLHRLAQGYPPVHAAHKIKLQKALVGGPGDDDPHLIHVGAQHQPVPGRLPAPLEHDEVAHGVGTDAVRVLLRPAADIAPHLSLVP